MQFGPGNYCDNYDMDILSFRENKKYGNVESMTAEVAYWGPEGVMQKLSDAEYADTVKGRVSPEDVLALMQDIAQR